MLALGCRYVLVTGAHEPTLEVLNTLYSATDEPQTERWQRLPGSYHGSGCTLASAIAARLAHGARVPQAVHEAQEFTWQALLSAYQPGTGQHLPDRFFWARKFADSAR
jgi:hydroxymethylpyrimidine/phosphomethylpyrimidine kinase